MLDICNAFVESRKYDLLALQTGEVNIRPTVPHPALKVIKSKRYNKKSFASRIISWAISFIHSLFLIWFKYPNAALFLVTNPPLNLFLPLFCKNRYSILIFDIYPDLLVAQGITSKNSIFIKIWNKINKRVMNKAENVYTISNTMAEVLSRYTKKNKIEVIQLWSHCETFKPLKKSDNPFLREIVREEKFIVLYAGNMGITHDMEVLVDVANELSNRDDILILYIGEGAKKKLIKQKIDMLQLTNCKILPYQPNEMLQYSIGSADIGVITLDSASGSLSIPSKTFTYLAVGSVILGICDDDSQLSHLIKKESLGASFAKDNITEIADYIKYIADNEKYKEKISLNNIEFARSFTPLNALNYVK